MTTFTQAKYVFIALASFLNLEEAVHADAPSPGENDGFIERVLEVPVRIVAKGDATLRFTLTVWDDHNTPDEWLLSNGNEDVAFSDVSRFYGLTQEQGAVIRALLD